jgi:hypothetical protein
MARQRKVTETVVARLNEQEAKIQRVSNQVELKTSAWQSAVDNR